MRCWDQPHFGTLNWWAANTSLSIVSNALPDEHHRIQGIDVSATRDTDLKGLWLTVKPLSSSPQLLQLRNPDARINLSGNTGGTLLSAYAVGLQGIATGDFSRFRRGVWELPVLDAAWSLQQGSFDTTILYAGREHVILWQNGRGELALSPQARIRATLRGATKV